MKLKHIFALSILAAAFGACTDHWSSEELAEAAANGVTLDAEGASLSCDVTGVVSETTTFNVAYDHTKWQITDIPSWVKVTPTAGGNTDSAGSNRVSVELEVNESTSAREGSFTLTVVGGKTKYSKSIEIKQPGSAPMAEIALSNGGSSTSAVLTVPGVGGSFSVPLVTNCIDDLELSYNSDYCVAAINKTNKTIVIDIEPINYERSFDIKIKRTDSYNALATLTVKQQGSYYYFVDNDGNKITGNSETWNNWAPYGGGVVVIPIETDCPDNITFVTEYYSSSQANGQSVPSTEFDAENNTVKVTFEKNAYGSAREVYLWMCYKGRKDRKITIKQNGPQFAFVDPDGNKLSNYNSDWPEYIPAAGGVVNVSVETNCPDDISISARFYSNGNNQTPTAEFDKSSSQIKVAIPENTSGYSRDVRVTVNFGPRQTERLLDITQRGAGISNVVDPDKISANGGSQSFSFSATGSWTLSYSSVDWISFDRIYGAGGENITVKATAKANSSSSGRSVYVTIEPNEGGNSKSFYVEQAGQGITISESHINVFDGAAASKDFEITSSGNWTVIDHPDWANLEPSHGSEGNTKCYIKMDALGFQGGNQYRGGKITVQIDGTNAKASISFNQYY